MNWSALLAALVCLVLVACGDEEETEPNNLPEIDTADMAEAVDMKTPEDPVDMGSLADAGEMGAEEMPEDQGGAMGAPATIRASDGLLS